MAAQLTLQRLHKLIWLLIYGGVLTPILGLAPARTHEALGWGLIVGGGGRGGGGGGGGAAPPPWPRVPAGPPTPPAPPRKATCPKGRSEIGRLDAPAACMGMSPCGASEASTHPDCTPMPSPKRH